jgi:branched-chain amino acid transport system permease protein
MAQLIAETILNGVQAGVFLFLIAAGLTLVFGIMNLVNLAHGSLFMMGAYFAAFFFREIPGFGADIGLTISPALGFLIAILIALPLSLLLGIVLEYLVIGWLYQADHLVQVLATFGLILFFNQIVLVVFGAASQTYQLPSSIDFPFPLFGFTYPFYRLIVIAAGLLVALGLYLVIARTRVGMLIRAGASRREMVGALGVNVKLLFTVVFGMGAALAGLAGILIGPIESVQSGMGEPKLILAFVVIVIGGIGSIRGAFVASIVVGLVEVCGRVFMKDLLASVLPVDFAQTAGPALSSMIIYILMAAVLFFKPEGLFPARTG